MGMFVDAVKTFNRVLQLQPDHFVVYFKKELCYYLLHRMNSSVFSVGIDGDVDKELKFGLSREIRNVRYPSVGENGEEGKAYSEMFASYMQEQLDKPQTSLSEQEKLDICDVVAKSSYLSSFLQLDSPGFLFNRRQHRQFSLAVVHAFQHVKRHVSCLLRTSTGDNLCEPGMGLKIETLQSSSPSTHVLDWRGFFDIFVRWRQISDFKDQVWWVDRLPKARSMADR